MESKKVGDYTVSPLSLDQLDSVSDRKLEGREFIYAVAVEAVTLKGKKIDRAHLGGMHAGDALELLRVVKDLNLPPAPDDEGN